MNELVIADAEPEDAEAIVQAHFAAVHETASAAYPEEVLNDWSPAVFGERVERMRRAITERQELCLIARWNGETVGFGSVVPEQNELRSLYVLPKVGRLGIGSKLLYALEALALAEGAAFLEMDASLNAMPFYVSHGYQAISQGFHKLRSGREMACVRMKKSLTNDLLP